MAELEMHSMLAHVCKRWKTFSHLITLACSVQVISRFSLSTKQTSPLKVKTETVIKPAEPVTIHLIERKE